MKYLSGLLFFLFAAGSLCAQQPERKYSDHYYKRTAEFAGEAPIHQEDIVLLGDSLTEGGDWSSYFPETERKIARKGGHIRNRGIVGDEVMGVYDRLDQILPGQPKKLFLLVGVNDISHHLAADSIVCMLRAVVERIRRESPRTRLYLQTLLPFNEGFHRYRNLDGKSPVVPEVNRGIRELAREFGVKCIDLYPLFLEKKGGLDLNPEITRDGLHLTPDGYRIWVKRIKKYMK